MINIQKAAVIGCGFVGSTIAYTLMQKGTFSELVLIDAVQAKEEGEAMDISHGLPFAHAMDIIPGSYDKPETGRDKAGPGPEEFKDHEINHQ